MNSRRIRSAVATLMASTLLLTLPLQAAAANATGNQSNTVTITIAGGDATALAACLNLVEKNKGGTVEQKNKCKNFAYAAGGDVILKNVDIFVVQTNVADGDISDQSNTVDLTIRGGDATALAACLNLVKKNKGGTVEQKNKCKNFAYAKGGDVVLKNVDITIIQENF